MVCEQQVKGGAQTILLKVIAIAFFVLIIIPSKKLRYIIRKEGPVYTKRIDGRGKKTNKQTDFFSFLFFLFYEDVSLPGKNNERDQESSRGVQESIVVVDGYKTQTNNLPDNVGRFVSIRWNKTSRDIHIKKGGI